MLLLHVDGSRHQVCGSVPQGMIAGAASSMPSFNTGAHHHGQVSTQYADSTSMSVPAHQPPGRHGHSVVNNVYAGVPGTVTFSQSITNFFCFKC